jgi:hypothetical protein
MNIKTKNPVIIDKQKVSPKDYYANASGDVSVDFKYLPTEEVSAGDIKVITKYPVVLDGSDISPKDYYVNASGSITSAFLTPEQLAALEARAKQTGTSPSKKDQDAAKEKGVFWDNLAKSWQSFTQSDVGKTTISQIDAALTARREAKYGSGQGGAFFPEQTAGQQAQAPMSTTTKVLLVGGGLLVAGLIVYAIVKR